MEAELQDMIKQVRSHTNKLKNKSDFEAYKATILGSKGRLTTLVKKIGGLSPQERPRIGRQINVTKKELETIFNQTLADIERQQILDKLGEPPDFTLAPQGHYGSHHPLSQIRDRIIEIFSKIGFVPVEGTEIETEYFAFDALNTPEHHPARSQQDTYYLPNGSQVGNVVKNRNECYLLRPHTSSVQIRTMQRERPPIRILSPGRCFRRDTADATHSASFHQIEGLFVDEKVSLKDLKATLDYFFREMLGKDAKIRFRPHFFPYTEPSFEVDFSSKHLKKIGKEWVEIMGCGMVDPSVFDAVSLDSNAYSGFAFGMGIERIAMILYGIDDIRYFYQNDLRFLQQFC